MTIREAIYKTALEHIMAGSDAVCTDCGLVGRRNDWAKQSSSRRCPLCGGKTVKVRPYAIAAYALAQGEKGE